MFVGLVALYFLVKRVHGRGLEQRESGNTILYPLIFIIFLVILLYAIIRLLIKMRTIPAKTGNGTSLSFVYFFGQMACQCY